MMPLRSLSQPPLHEDGSQPFTSASIQVTSNSPFWMRLKSAPTMRMMVRAMRKMTVTMALYRARDLDHAIELTNRIQAYQGQGHSCGIYSYNDDNIMKLLLEKGADVNVVNEVSVGGGRAVHGAQPRAQPSPQGT